MSLWILEPRDTLVLRDGRPMVGTGLQLDSMPLPWPSTVAGFLRTRSGSDEEGRFRFADDPEAAAHLLEHSVEGPLLADFDAEGRARPMPPCPRDALGLEARPAAGTGSTILVARVGRSHRPLASGESSDVPDGMELLFRSGPQLPGRASLPLFWSWSFFEGWLETPDAQCGERQRGGIGTDGGDLEHRTHVRIDGSTQTAAEGMLFQLGHRRFVTTCDRHRLSTARRHALLVRTELSGIRPGTWPFAGERRLVHLREQPDALPAPSDALLATIAECKRARMILLTPAIFERGWRPEWILRPDSGLTVTLRSATLGRPIAISGWDYARRRPKPIRRAVPAGAVYFLSFEGTEEQIATWLRDHWWRPMSDEAQARSDGFGIAVFGVDVPVGEED